MYSVVVVDHQIVRSPSMVFFAELLKQLSDHLIELPPGLLLRCFWPHFVHGECLTYSGLNGRRNTRRMISRN
jgi:hypothetical protein